jgi:hypothetical protein
VKISLSSPRNCYMRTDVQIRCRKKFTDVSGGNTFILKQQITLLHILEECDLHSDIRDNLKPHTGTECSVVIFYKKKNKVYEQVVSIFRPMSVVLDVTVRGLTEVFQTFRKV